MRDPEARIRFERGQVIRDLYKPLPDDHFLRHELARTWMSDGRLVPFEIEDDTRVLGRKLDFVSQPSEWTDAQFFAAAKLTLDLQIAAVEAGFDLKDGSAWNVLFDGCRPIFCDLMSFGLLTQRKWWAFGQYARHFLLPLLASQRAGLRAWNTFTLWRDGMPPDIARHMLGWKVLLSRYAPLTSTIREGAHSSILVESSDAGTSVSGIRRFRSRLHATLEWQLQGLGPRVSAAPAGWAGYREDRPHYSAEGLATKRSLVDDWLARLAPSWVLDLGCNTGEFSAIALARGAQVIALDSDHDSVQRMFMAHLGCARLHPVVSPLDDLRSSRGWAGHEHPGLDQRLDSCSDVVLMLALLHHLAIGAAIPLHEISRFANRCTRRALIVEFIHENDPQLVALCRQRQRDPRDINLERQREAFLRGGFSLQSEQTLSGDTRTLALLFKR